MGLRHVVFEKERPPASVSVLPSVLNSEYGLTKREVQIVSEGIKFLREQAKIKAHLELVEVNRGLAETSYGYIYLCFLDGDEYWLEVSSHSSLSLATGRITLASYLVPFTHKEEVAS